MGWNTYIKPKRRKNSKKHTFRKNLSRQVACDGLNFLSPLLDIGYLLFHYCAKLKVHIALGLVMSNLIFKACNRCCFAREFPGKCLTSVASYSRPRPIPSQWLMHLEPKAISFFKKEEPHGFKTVCRGIAVFSNPRRIN